MKKWIRAPDPDLEITRFQSERYTTNAGILIQILTLLLLFKVRKTFFNPYSYGQISGTISYGEGRCTIVKWYQPISLYTHNP